MGKGSRIEIRLSDEEKRRILALAERYRVSATQILLAGARFLQQNPQVAQAILGEASRPA